MPFLQKKEKNQHKRISLNEQHIHLVSHTCSEFYCLKHDYWQNFEHLEIVLSTSVHILDVSYKQMNKQTK